MQELDAGMGRFFSPTNLDRYRKLASGALDETERHQIMEDLAREMNVFRHEARIAAIAGERASDGEIGSGIGD